MDGNNKKNGIIRLLGKLGRRVKFLRVPLTVIVVIGASVKALFKRLFFDMSYHKVRMRVGVGAVCAALVATLFVIPAIAGDADILSTVFESLSSEEEASPSPSPSEDEETYSGLDFDPNQEVTDENEDKNDQTADTPSDEEGGEADQPGDNAESDADNNADNSDNSDGNNPDDVINPNALDLKDRGPALKVRNDTITYSFNSAGITVNYKDSSAVTTNTFSGDATVHDPEYNYGEVPAGESFSVVVKGKKITTPSAGSPTEEDNITIPESAITYQWYLDTTQVSATSSYTLGSGSTITAGTHTVQCKVRTSDTDWISVFFKIKIKKGTLTQDNLVYSKSGLSDKYYVTFDEDREIPTEVPQAAWDGVHGEQITAKYVFYNQSDTKVEKPWTTPGTYYARVEVTNATNYKIYGNTLDDDHVNTYVPFAGANTFTVEKKLAPNAIPINNPPLPKGTEKAGAYGEKWYLEDVKLRATGAYKMSVNDEEYVTEKTLTSSKDPQTIKLKFKESGKYPIYESANAASPIEYSLGDFYVDTDKPTGKLMFNSTDEGDGSGFYKDSVSFEVTSTSDITSDISDDNIFYKISGTPLTAKNINDWTQGESGTIDCTEFKSGVVRVYVKLVDNAGNVSYIDDKYITMDTTAPKFFCAAGEITEDEKTFYMESGKTKTITVTDEGEGNFGLKTIVDGGITSSPSSPICKVEENQKKGT
ncbi:MAG: hypothetical protein IJL75_05920, partial [Eubacterium sp.]|nr:hypothetical protein [Eubacterium sp.]